MEITILLIAVLLSMMMVFRIRIMEPAGIYSVMWILFIVGSIVSLKNQYEFAYSGINWILVSCCMAIIVSYFFAPKLKVLEQTKTISKNMPSIPWKLLICFILIAMCSVGYTMVTAGVGFDVFLNFTSLQNTAHIASVNRYSSGENVVSLLNQVLGTFIYIAPICAGYSFIFAENKMKKMICFSSALPALFSMLLTSAKLSVIAFVMLFFVGFYIAYVYQKGHVPYIKAKTIGLLSIAVIMLYALFYLSFVLRIGNEEKNISKTIVDKLMIYAFGHVQGVDIWFDRNAFNIGDYAIWKNTFLAISSKLGLAVKNQGVYGFIPDVCTNVYSQFRGLIEDVGPFFAIVILFAFFMLSYFMLSKIASGQRNCVIAQTLLAANLFWLIYFIVSAWTYTTFLLTFVIFGFFLYICFYMKFV